MTKNHVKLRFVRLTLERVTNGILMISRVLIIIHFIATKKYINENNLKK